MFTINYFFKTKIIGSETLSTLEEAENKYGDSQYYSQADRFEIVDLETEEIMIEEEIVDPDDIIEWMFDDEDSREGVDWMNED